MLDNCVGCHRYQKGKTTQKQWNDSFIHLMRHSVRISHLSKYVRFVVLQFLKWIIGPKMVCLCLFGLEGQIMRIFFLRSRSDEINRGVETKRTKTNLRSWCDMLFAHVKNAWISLYPSIWFRSFSNSFFWPFLMW